MPESEDEYILFELKIVGEISLSLHMQRSDDLSIPLSIEKQREPFHLKTDDFLIDGKTIHFPSIEARNRCVASYVFEKNQIACLEQQELWLSIAHDLWRCEIGKTDSAAGRLLALVHNSQDIFSIAVQTIQSERMRVHNVLHVIEATLPYLEELPVDGIINLCAAQYELTKNDLAVGILFSKLEKVLLEQPVICRAIHDRLRLDISDAIATLHTTALLSLVKSSLEDAVNLALEDAKSQNPILKNIAIWTLGRMLLLPSFPTDFSVVVSAIIFSNLTNAVERIRHTAILSAANAIPVANFFDVILVELGQSGDQHALAAIANTLMSNLLEMKNKVNYTEWIRLLCKLSPLSTAAIENFDFILSQLMGDECQQQFAIACLTDWVNLNSKDALPDISIAEIFDSTIFKLSNRPELLSQVITDWFLSDNRRLAFAATDLLSNLGARGFEKPEFSKTRLDTLEERDLIFLARRLLGFISKEEHLISLSMSLFKTKDAPQRIFGIVYSMLVDEIGRDYPDTTIKALEIARSSAVDSEWESYYSNAIEEISGRIKTLEALPHLIELRPSPNLQREFARARAKQMNKSFEEAQKDSIVRQLATEIPIKAGMGTFSFRDGTYSDTSFLQPFSHSVLLPRRYVLDSVGYDISRLFFRISKREDT